ncbi:MAG: polyphenol oxidase family protein [Acidimicrobiia bacterium]
MIRPPGFRGAAFGDEFDGDGRSQPVSRAAISTSLGISSDWAWLRQVHGRGVVRVSRSGPQGDADAAFTTQAGLPLAVATADCYPVILEADGAVGIAHSGWRGTAAGVVGALREAMAAVGFTPARAAIGPGIGPCCFEVGAEVAAQFPDHRRQTAWGTLSVDLRGDIVAALAGLDVWDAGVCTMSDDGYHSHRRDRASERQVAVAWLPG